MEKVLELQNVTKRMDGKTLVQDITFSINKGEIFGFLGPNGAGKTTTIKMITGLYSITEGEVYIGGYDVKKEFEKALNSVGGIIENPEMYSYLSGLDNLKLYARMHDGVSKERINEVIKLVKLENRINDKVKTYSLGMRQRLGVAQALLHKPKLIILDEPTNGLDPMGIKELRETLRYLAEHEGISVLVSSHLLSEMELMCDRFGIIDGGKFMGIKSLVDIKQGTTEVVTTKYRIKVIETNKAYELIKKVENVIVNIEQQHLIVECPKEIIPLINRMLVKNDHDVYELIPFTKTLEDEFLEITQGSKGQIR